MIKKISLYKMSYFPGPYEHSKNEVKVNLDLSNYAKKPNLKMSTGVDPSDFPKKSDLASLNSDVGK